MSREKRERPASFAERELTADEIQALIELHQCLSEADARLADAIAGIASSGDIRVAEAPDGAHLHVRGVLPWPQAIQLLVTLKGQPRPA